MPSRKKAQGKARKEKRAAACTHGAGARSLGDIDAAGNLANKYLLKCNGISLSAVKDEQAAVDIDRLQHEVYDEYCQFNDNGKKLFKEMMVSNGTAACIRAAKQTDLSKVRRVQGTLPYISIILTIEVRDSYDGAYDQHIHNEIQRSLNDTTHCPRETVRFLHRRNSCGCLKELYYKLKESTQRTAACWNCMNIVEIRKLSRCLHCKVAQYCSYDCAVAHWQVVHKGECKEIWHCEDA